MLEKSKVIEALLVHLEGICRNMESSLQELRERVRDAPGANVSHSDTTKSQLSAVALGSEAQLLECRHMVAALQSVCTTSSSSVCVGSLTMVRAPHGDEWYLILPKARGDSVVIGGVEVTAISVTAPLSKALLNHSVGEIISWRGVSLEVVHIE